MSDPIDGARWRIIQGDCRETMASMPAESVDAIVTDPPYGLSFMGKGWDHGVPGVEFWAEALRVAKPGAHLLAFGGTRTFHRLTCAIEDAGWEVRDCIMWVYGSGFPKSLDVSKAIDKAAGAEREEIGPKVYGGGHTASKLDPGGRSVGEGWQRPWMDNPEHVRKMRHTETAPATEAARRWAGWGTALKPAWEPIIVARKPIVGTVAANVLEHGTGALNIDGCRVESGGNTARPPLSTNKHEGWQRPWNSDEVSRAGVEARREVAHDKRDALGRWPANLVHDGSPEVVAGFPDTGPAKASMRGVGLTGAEHKVLGRGDPNFDSMRGHDDQGGSAARFFYCAKASKADRDEGLDGFEARPSYMVENGSRTAAAANGVRYERHTLNRNHHPTVKPVDLMRYLCRLVTPPGGLVLDPFCGSGSTGKAALLEGFRFAGCELQAEYVAIAQARLGAVVKSGTTADLHGAADSLAHQLALVGLE